MIDPIWLFVSLISGSAGFVLFVYGKRQQRWPHLAAGVLLMLYPYFTPGLLELTGAGMAIAVGLWLAVRQGW